MHFHLGGLCCIVVILNACTFKMTTFNYALFSQTTGKCNQESSCLIKNHCKSYTLGHNVVVMLVQEKVDRIVVDVNDTNHSCFIMYDIIMTRLKAAS